MTIYQFPSPTIGEDETLMYYDGPLLILVTLGEGHRVLGIMLDRGEKDPFLLVELTADQEKRLLNNTATLRSLCLESIAPGGLGAYHLDDFNESTWTLERLDSIDEENMPGDVCLLPELDTPTVPAA